jgi:hypothetical protein
MDSISAPAHVTNAPGALDAAVAAVGKLNLDTLEAPVRLHLLEQLEASRRKKSPHPNRASLPVGPWAWGSSAWGGFAEARMNAQSTKTQFINVLETRCI